MGALSPGEAYGLLRQAIPRRPELRFQCWPDKKAFQFAKECKWKCDYRGFCYIATQAFCQMVPEAKPYELDRGHWWAQIGDDVYDSTYDQFDFSFPYDAGKRTKFKQLSARAEALLEECLTIKTERSLDTAA